ncbi:uncharacterized protein [Amphiura filiformis]|uniref:uncharacterized protein n=1 Tax=Amphiura filiformis TaxID=82378 RepID=UPI003B2165DC
MSVQLTVDNGSYNSSLSLFTRTSKKLPKVEPPSSQPRTRTGWLRWPFHRLEPLREEQMKKSSVTRLKPINNPENMNHVNVSRKRVDGGMVNVVPVVTLDHNSAHKSVKVKNSNELKEVKRRPPRPNSAQTRGRNSGQNNHHNIKCNDSTRKRLSYPPCDTVGLHEYMQRLHTNDLPTDNKVTETRLSRLSHEFSTSCPALYNPKYADRLHESHSAHFRRHDSRRHKVPSHHSKNHEGGHDKLKTSKHHQKGITTEFLSEHQQQTKVHQNHVKSKVKKSKSYPNRESVPITRPQRPKPPSWQDQAPPSVTVTEPTEKDPSLIPNTNSNEKNSSAAAAAKPESILAAATSILDGATDARGGTGNRRSGLSRSHLKRTRSRVIDAREIPREDAVIPLSRTQQREFNLKETHQDNRIYLTENAQRCRKWLADLEVEDLRDDEGGLLSTGYTDANGNTETITFDLEVSHERWNYLGSPYPSDSDSDAD